MSPTRLKMGCLWLLFLNGLCPGLLAQTGQSEGCGNKAFTDSLVEVYSQKAWKWGYNHPQWQASWDSLLAVCPNVAFAYREKAIPYIKNGNYAKAFELEDKAVALDPRAWIAYRGFLHCVFSKNYEKALEDFSSADSLASGNFVMDHTYDFYRGLCFLGMKEYPLAVRFFDADLAAQSKENTHFNSYFYAGLANFLSDNYSEAERLLKSCLQTYPQQPEANYYLSKVYQATGRTSDSAQSSERAKQYFQEGFGLNEANVIYVNYPYQISYEDLGLPVPAAKGK